MRRMGVMWGIVAVFVTAGGAAAEVTAVGVVGVTVSDAERAARFYEDVLDFRREWTGELDGERFESLQGVFGLRARVIRLRLGDERLELTQYLAPEGRPVPLDSRSNDRWFQHVAIVVRDMDAAYGRLREHSVRHASSGPQRLPDWNPAAGGIEAFYFKDPDGHILEVLEFPAGKGDPRWHTPGSDLFLGIDHTAIVVGDTDASLAFYRDLLGMDVAGRSENWGLEQERLNNVFGARLRITTLRAVSGPGIELLEYLAPSDGRDYPRDARPNDLVHWQTDLVTDDFEATLDGLGRSGYRRISASAVELADAPLGFRRGALVRDADGHAMRLVECGPANERPAAGSCEIRRAHVASNARPAERAGTESDR